MSFTTQTPSASPVSMDLPTFLRLFQMRSAQVMWFLGAGASRNAGVKTAWDMIWDFKQKMFCSQKKVPTSIVTDLSDPTIQAKLQAHFDRIGGYPPPGAEDEYSAYFEATYPSGKDRRRYLDEVLADARPSFGHRALALLMKEKLCRVVWTTNFDRLVEDSVAQLFHSTSRLVVADLGEPRKLRQALAESRWPLLGKIHGDFHSERLKNTSDELREQDAEMLAGLVEACRTFGLAVVGYSGRDASVLAALNSALDAGRGFPGGLFWFKRAGEAPFAGVINLLSRAHELGVEAYLIEVETFDELMSDLVRFVPATAEKLGDIAGSDRPRLGKASLRPSTSTTPVVRLNALPITSWPASCRLIACEIGGTADVQLALERAKADAVATRVGLGVVAFGADAELRRAFDQYGISRFETYAVSPKRLARETGERALLREALARALGRRPNIIVERRGRSILLFPDPARVRPEVFNSTSKVVDRLIGTVPGTTVRWREVCGVRLDWRLDRLWLLLEPRLAIDINDATPTDEAVKAREFVRNRRALRRNKEANSLLDGWVMLIVGTEQSLRLRAFATTDGLDAEFELARITAFSGKTRI